MIHEERCDTRGIIYGGAITMSNLQKMQIPVVMKLVRPGCQLILESPHLILNKSIATRIVWSRTYVFAVQGFDNVRHDAVAIFRSAICDECENDPMS